MAGITGRGQNAYVTISNHAEGCAPRTALALAQAVALTGGAPSGALAPADAGQ
jgi:uncharacterized protein YecE (DUF72 family)